MRKETIKKYFKQFEAWVNNKNVLVGSPASMDDASKGVLTWRKVTCIEDFRALDTKYVLDDFAVELRKAIAAGKEIHFWKIKEAHETDSSKDTYHWVKLNRVHLNYAFEKDLSLYKIV